MDIDMAAYEPPLSLWGIIQEHIADSEQFEVKRVLGEDLVEQSTELRQEINTLLEIFHDFNEEHGPLPPKPLDSSDVRDRLKNEILFFLEGIREQAHVQGRKVNSLLSGHNMEVIDYAYESGSSRPSTSDGSRPSTASLRTTPLSTGRRSDHVDVGAMKEKLNYLKFDDVRNNLRQRLQAEVRQLMDDLAAVQDRLYSADTARCASQLSISREPTVAELTEERRKLEKTFLDSSRLSSPVLRQDIGPRRSSSNRAEPLELPRRPSASSKPSIGPLRAPPLPSVTPTTSDPLRPLKAPAPPSDPSPHRPNSVHRLRRMVLESRIQSGAQ